MCHSCFHSAHYLKSTVLENPSCSTSTSDLPPQELLTMTTHLVHNTRRLAISFGAVVSIIMTHFTTISRDRNHSITRGMFCPARRWSGTDIWLLTCTDLSDLESYSCNKFGKPRNRLTGQPFVTESSLETVWTSTSPESTAKAQPCDYITTCK